MKKAIVFGIVFLLLLTGLYQGFVLITKIHEGNDSTEFTIDAPADSSTNTYIAHNLLNQWLTHSTQKMYLGGIRDFSFNYITILHEDQAQGTFLVEAAFSVLPKDDPKNSTWYGGAGGGSIDGQWIRGKVLRFQIICQGDICRLDVLG